MATETFFKRIVLTDKAAEQLADGLERQREAYTPSAEVREIDRRSNEWIESYLSQSNA